MRRTAPTTGIAVCPISTALEERGESAYGYKQTYSRPKSTSALPPKADVAVASADFRCWLQGDIQRPEIYVCFAPRSRHFEAHAGLLLVTLSGHRGLSKAI